MGVRQKKHLILFPGSNQCNYGKNDRLQGGRYGLGGIRHLTTCLQGGYLNENN